MGRKAKPLEMKRIIFSTTLTPKIAKEIEDLHCVSPTSQVLSTLIEDGLKLRSNDVKFVFPIKNAVYERICERMRPNETINGCIIRLLTHED